MSTNGNPARALLEAGRLAVGVGVRVLRSVEVAPMMKSAGMDFLFIDLEHGPASVETAYSISVAALGAGITPLVRVPRGELTLATRCLDGGAQGIVMPHVDTADEARAIVDALRFAPLGHRSIVGGYPQFGFAPRPAAEAVAELNASTLVVVMLETPQAIANADAIAAVPGIDALLVGTNDLCLEMGIPGKLDDPRLEQALGTVVRACRAHGRFAGLGGIYTRDLLKRYLPLGFQLLLAGNDLPLLMAAATEQAAFVRSCIQP